MSRPRETEEFVADIATSGKAISVISSSATIAIAPRLPRAVYQPGQLLDGLTGLRQVKCSSLRCPRVGRHTRKGRTG